MGCELVKMKGATYELSEYLASTTFDDLPEDVVDWTKRIVLDTVGAGIGACKTDAGKHVIDFSKKMSEKEEATILGDGAKVSSLSAALANGTLTKILGMDDNHRLYGHIAAPIIPVALIASELKGASGVELITSVVVSYEVFGKLYKAIGEDKERVWWTVGNFCCLGAATAAAKIFGFDREQMKDTIGLVTTLSSLSLLEYANDSRPNNVLELQSGVASLLGLLSSLLVRNGFRGASTAIEGELGFLRMLAPKAHFTTSLNQAIAELGKKYEITQVGLKPFGACRWIHPAIDAISNILREHAVTPESIEKVTVRTFRKGLTTYGRNYEPKSIVTAGMSFPFFVALYLVDGKVERERFFHYNDKTILDLAKKVKIVIDPELDKIYPEKFPSIVEIETKSGEKFVGRVDYARGEPENPMSDEELVSKFKKLADSVIPSQKINSAAEMLMNLEKLNDTRELIKQLHP
jgi:2-methylcitrate dehydratase PrpD